MRRMITRLIIAKLIPVAIRYITKAFRKTRSAVKQPDQTHSAQTHPSQAQSLRSEAHNNNDEIHAIEDQG